MSKKAKKNKVVQPSKEIVRARQEERREELAIEMDQSAAQRFFSWVPSAVWVAILIFAIFLLVFSFFYREMVTALISFALVIFVDRCGGTKIFRRYDEQEVRRRIYFGLPGTGELNLEQRNTLRRRQSVHSARRRHDNALIQNAKKIAKKTGADQADVLADLKAREMDQIMGVAEKENEQFDSQRL